MNYLEKLFPNPTTCFTLCVSMFFTVGTTRWMFGPGNTTDALPILMLVGATTASIYAIKCIQKTAYAQAGAIISSVLGAVATEAFQGAQMASHVEPVIAMALMAGFATTILLRLEKENSAKA